VTDALEPRLTYRQIVGRNISAARGRLRLRQSELAERMRTLGFEVWTQQTVAVSEKATRRVTTEEILGLAVALETSIASLMSGADFDGFIELPNGQLIGAVSVERLAGRGMNDRSVKWAGNDSASYSVLRRLSGMDPLDPSAPVGIVLRPGTPSPKAPE
jgi:transcriptional regulator with XRE-family HTH domain